MANIEDLRDRSVSSGTLKSEDLIPKFLGVLKTYGKDKYDAYIKENPEVEDWEDLDDETLGWVVDELTDLLNEIAPEGCFFGASEGDGADFGFWSMSNESKKSEVVSDTDPDDMKVGKFAVTLLADDDEYVGSVPGFYDDEVSAENAAKDYLKKNGSVIKAVGSVPTKIRIWTVVKDDFGSNLPKDVKVVNITADESKKSESLTLKQKELKDMARFGQAEDITTISDAEAKELKKKGIETVGISRGTYGMNGALLRDNEGNKYVITARSSNLFYFV